MKNLFVWAMIGAAALTVPALGGGGRAPAVNGRNPGANRTGAALPAMPIGSGRGQTLELTGNYAVLEETSIFEANRGVDPPGGGILPPPPPRFEPQPQPQALPVFRASLLDDIGPVALMEVFDARGAMTIEYLREGETFSWDGSTVQSITLDTLSLSRTSGSGAVTTVEVPIGRDLSGRVIGQLPVTQGYVSADMAPARNTGTMRTGRGRGVTGGTPGGYLNSGMSPAAGNAAAPLATLVGSPLDPPLPPGSADDIAGRMAQRRQMQLGALTAVPASAPASSGVR